MVYDPREFARVRAGLLALAGGAWLGLLAGPGAPLVCAVPEAALAWPLLLVANPPALLAWSWGLMLVAMMAPLLAAPLEHVRIGSFARRRVRSWACWVAGYGLVWSAAGVMLLAAKLTLLGLIGASYLCALVAAGVALLWQVSPMKQIALNRCHRRRPFAAFGFAADRDLFCAGVEHGAWCVISCWALMFFPLLLPQGHLAAMAAVGVLMYCERLDPPAAPAWGWRGFETAWRYAARRLRGLAALPPRPMPRSS